MNRQNNVQLEIVRVGNLIPYSHRLEGGVLKIRANHLYTKYTNWSVEFRNRMFESNFDSVTSFFSGSGKFLRAGPVLIDQITNEIIAIIVRNYETGIMMYLISDRLDTPKCPRKYKAFRTHWRKGLFSRLERSSDEDNINMKIVKTDHKFLQNFLMKFNYNPNAKEISKLKAHILIRTISHLD